MTRGSESFYDAIIIGAGFSGLQQLHFLRDKLNMNVLLHEKGSNVGGTWYWNRYPGARCDSESHSYCYFFSDDLLKDWSWSERYPSQREILEYLNFVSDQFDLKRSIEFNSKVIKLVYSSNGNFWELETNRHGRFKSKFVICAVGCLSTPFNPKIPGRETYRGNSFHTGDWPKNEVNFKGKAVGVIGTGSSGIQAIPVIAETAKRVTVFQRSPNYSVPARNKKLQEKFKEEFISNINYYKSAMYAARHGHPWVAPNTSVVETDAREREAILESAWKIGGLRFRESFGDTLINAASNDLISQFIKKKIHQVVKDRQKAKMLTDFDHPFGTKRPAVDSNYYETFNRANVTLVDLKKEPIKNFTFSGIETTEQQFDFDVVVFATGFDAITGSILKIDIRGKQGVKLKDIWKNNPVTYLGLQVSGFPNLFFITGPGSPSVLTNMPQAIDQHVNWIMDCIKFMDKNNFSVIEAKQCAMENWTIQVREAVEKTLFLSAKNSWYSGANVPGKADIFLPYVGGLNNYRKICDSEAENGYRGFSFI